MTSLPDSARAVLESSALAHLVTLNPDGSPQVTVVWVGLDGDEIVAAHLPEHRKVEKDVQHLTDDHIKRIDDTLAQKEKDILQV